MTLLLVITGLTTLRIQAIDDRIVDIIDVALVRVGLALAIAAAVIAAGVGYAICHHALVDPIAGR